MADCLFCKIAGGEIPAKLVLKDDQVIAFRDINPQAPVHVLVIPRRHIGSLNELGPDDAALMGHLHLVANQVARAEQIAEGGWRAVFNTGKHGGQTVHHLHLHVLGGRPLLWPPG